MRLHHRFFTFLCTASFLAIALAVSGKQKPFTVVLDAGHGGSDIGAPGLVTNEKTVNLQVALLVGKLLKSDIDNVNIVYTRDKDVFVPLQKRADIANKAAADLFVSIHANSVDKRNKNRRTISGASVYTLGLDRSEANLEVAMRENSVIKLEDDYTTTYEGFDPQSSESYIIFELGQNKHMQHSIEVADAVQKQLISTAGRQDHGVRQANFWVLLKTAMPSILVELDFICNPTQERFMNSKEGQNKLARAIATGITDYHRVRSNSRPPLKQTESKPERPAPAKPKPAVKPAERPTADAPHQTTEQKTSKPAEKPTAKPQPERNKPAAASESKTDRKNSQSGKIVYKIQFLSSPTPLATNSGKLHGLRPVESYKDGNMWKYTYGQYPTAAQASSDLKKVRKHFPDAFVITTRDGKRIK